MSTRHSRIHHWIEQFLRADPPRSKSLMVSLLGDSIAPRAGGLWLSELIALLRPFQMNERLVRTSTFRLAEEGWLASQRHGRRSRYLLTEAGFQRIEIACQRIYQPAVSQWSGVWTVIVISRDANGAESRSQLWRELEWEGFGKLSPNIALHPCADHRSISAILQEMNLEKSAMVLEARELTGITPLPIRALVDECWNLEALAQLYKGFLGQFEPLLYLLGEGMDGQAAFVVQTLLIHSFRRVILHDPRFPAELLPDGWPGHAAYELCRSLYLRLWEQTSNYLAAHLESPGAEIISRGFYRRFGGLSPGSLNLP